MIGETMNIPVKLQSRKFWNAVVGELVGIITLFIGVAQAEIFATIAGATIMVLVVLGYIKVEGDIDKERIKKGS